MVRAMDAERLEREWELVRDLLPGGVEELARSTGALKRARGLDGAVTMLRLILMHAATGLSLRSTVGRAKLLGIAQISDVALMDRLRNAEPWLRELTRQMLDRRPFPPIVPKLKKQFRIRAVDATTVEEPGATGTTWRVHYSIVLPELTCDFFEITGTKGGETYTRLPVRDGDLVLADRGYCHREGVAHVIRAGGVAVVRLNLTSFPLLDRRQRPFEILPHLRRLDGFKPAQWPVRFTVDNEGFEAHLCAIRKSDAAAELARKKIRRRAQRNSLRVRPETLEAAGFVFVLSTASTDQLDAREVLGLYRLRWQVELCFKRMKSLLGVGHLPKYDQRSARSWIQAKLLTVLLIEEMMTRAGFFSPWGFDIPATQSLARVPARP
jgi:hypothetical protein